MTLQRRLVLAVLLAAPLAWALTIAATYWHAAHEIDELYDNDMVRMAQQMGAAAPLMSGGGSPAPLPHDSAGDDGHLGDLAVAIWRRDGTLLLDADTAPLPRLDEAEGFVEAEVNGEPWRLYFLNEPQSGARVAVGQRLGERRELIVTYIASQILPWLLGLPVLIGLLALAVRQALAPVRSLSAVLERRAPDDATLLRVEGTPSELRPLIQAMNGLLARVAAAIAQERRLTADAAHELRTPLAALKAHWDVARRTAVARDRDEALDSVDRGIERLDRLVSQLLTMARLDNAARASLNDAVDWRVVAEQAIADCLWLADRRDIDLETRWPAQGAALPIVGDNDALVIMLKNVLENAIRYGAAHSAVRIAFAPDRIVVDDQGPGVAADIMPRLGDRFFRAPGQSEPGSGLGLSIARHIAHSHGLALRFENRPAGDGLGAGLRVVILRDEMPRHE